MVDEPTVTGLGNGLDDANGLDDDVSVAVSNNQFAVSSNQSATQQTRYAPTRQQLDQFLLRLLLRHYRPGQPAAVADRVSVSQDDMEILKRYWSISDSINDLSQYVVRNRHEAHATLTERRTRDDALIRGRLDARQTLIERQRTGYPTRVVFWEATKTFASDPNHVLAWVLYNALYLARHFAREANAGSIATRAYGAIVALESAKRIENISLVLAESRIHARPTPRAVASAARSRTPLYRLAATAYQELLRIERLDEVALANVLRQSLVAPLETWRAFELAVALAAANAISSRVDEKVLLSPISPGASEILISVGPFAIAWQTRTSSYHEPAPEPSETLAREIWTHYGLRPGEDRPDLVIVHTPSRTVVGLAEVKHYADVVHGWRNAIREGASQLVRYSRGYTENEEQQRGLLSRSLIAMWFSAPLRAASLLNQQMPIAISFNDLTNCDDITSSSTIANARVTPALTLWADRVVRSTLAT